MKKIIVIMAVVAMCGCGDKHELGGKYVKDGSDRIFRVEHNFADNYFFIEVDEKQKQEMKFIFEEEE